MNNLRNVLCAHQLLKFTPELPSDAEASSARRQLEIAEAELQRLDYERFWDPSYRAHVEDRICRCRSFLAPYKKLPAELIAEIIRLCVPDSAVLPLKYGRHDPHLQMVQICTTWRNVAFSMPTLWRVRISRGPKGSIRLVDAWFHQCSGSQLVLTMPDSFHFMVAQSNAVLTDIIMPHAARFRSLGPLAVTTQQWNLICSLPFKSLEALYIDPRCFGDGTVQPRRLLSAPVLQKFHLEGIYGGENKYIRLPSLPFYQITSLCLTGDPVASNILELLAQCPSLTNCKLHSLSYRSIPTPLSDILLRFPHLKSMSISKSPALYSILSRFALPALSSFEIDVLPSDEGSVQQIIQFVRSVSTTLRSFAISTIYWGYIDIDEDFLSAVPLLTDFSLPRGYGFRKSTLLKIGRGELLPDIERLQFHAISRDRVGAILEMLGSRQSSMTSSLRQVYLHRKFEYPPLFLVL